MKQIFLLSFFLFSVSALYSQDYVTTNEIFNASTEYEFNNEWQYVSTDLYLFNSSKFNNLLNKINPGKRSNRRNRDREIIKNILVTAQLNGLGDLDNISYPIFNFIVTEDDDGNFQAQVSEPDAIRIIDNYPVTAIDDYVGAKITVQVYSDKNKSDLYKFIGAQLQYASSLNAISASDAALKAVGEIGNFMQKDAAGSQYQFESTIRFYQQTDFDRRLHSISIFVFQPSKSTSSGFDLNKISNFFDTTTVASIDKNKLEQLLNYNLYPYVVAVNYRSKYKPQISSDVNNDVLRVRKTSNENDYKNEIISEAIYNQENSLIDFLYVYVDLLEHISEYERDYDEKITSDFSIHLFLILQDYWKLKNFYKITKKQYNGNPLFENQFKQLYERYLTQAKLKFEGNSSLRAIREHVETIFALENDGMTKLDSAQREDFLRKLNIISFPDRELNSNEAKVSTQWIKKLETEQFVNIYKPQIDFLRSQPVDTSTYDKVQLLRLQSANSYCETCKDNVLEYETEFMNYYERYLLRQSKMKYYDLINQTKSDILVYSKKQSCINDNLDTIKNKSQHIIVIQSSLETVKEQTKELISLTADVDVAFATSDEYKEKIDRINLLKTSIEAIITSICDNDPQYCDCNSLYKRHKNKASDDR